MAHSPKITGNSKYRVFLSSHFLKILSTQEEMKLWKKQVRKSRSSTLYPCALICLPLCSLHPAPSLMLFCSPLCWLSMAFLHTLLSPGVLLCCFSTKGTISSQRGFGDCHLSAGVQDKKRDQNSAN